MEDPQDPQEAIIDTLLSDLEAQLNIIDPALNAAVNERSILLAALMEIAIAEHRTYRGRSCPWCNVSYVNSPNKPMEHLRDDCPAMIARRAIEATT